MESDEAEDSGADLRGCDELCRVRGTVAVGGAAHAIDCVGTRCVIDGVDAGSLGSARMVSGWFDHDEAFMLLALRAAEAVGHESDLVAATLFDPEGWVPVDDPAPVDDLRRVGPAVAHQPRAVDRRGRERVPAPRRGGGGRRRRRPHHRGDGAAGDPAAMSQPWARGNRRVRARHVLDGGRGPPRRTPACGWGRSSATSAACSRRLCSELVPGLPGHLRRPAGGARHGDGRDRRAPRRQPAVRAGDRPAERGRVPLPDRRAALRAAGADDRHGAASASATSPTWSPTSP